MLHENIELYRELIENLPDGVCLHRGRIILFANRAAAQLLGASSPAALEGMDILETVHPDNRAKVIESINRTAVDSQAGFLEQKLVSFDGAAVWADVRVTAKIIDGERGAIVVMRDATQRRQASEELRKAQDRLRDAIECVPNGFALWGPDDRLVFRNNEFSAQYAEFGIAVPVGVEFAQMSKAFLREILKVPPETLEATAARRLAEHRSANGEREVMLSGNRYYQTAERPTSDGGIVTIRTDVTEFRRNEQALRESEEQFRLLFEMAPHGIVMHRGGIVLHANLAAAKIMGVPSPNDMVGSRISKFLPPDEAAAAIRRGQDVLERETSEAGVHEVRAGRGDGREIILEARATPFALRGHEAVLVHFQDVTERVKSREALDRAQDRLSDAIRSMPDGFAIFDADDRLVLFNEPYKQFYDRAAHLVAPGISFADLARRFLIENDVCAPEDVESRVARRMESRSGREDARYELALPNGQIYENVAQRTRDGGTFVVRRNITESRRAERVLRDSAERYRLLFEGAPNGMLVRRGGIYTNANSTAARILHAPSPADIIGRSASDFLPHSLVATANSIAEKLRLNGAEFSEAIETPLRCFDGQEIIAEAVYAPFPSEGDDALLIHFRDVTKRFQAREALRLAQQQLEDAVESMPEGFALWGPDDRLVLFNQPFRKFYGKAQDALVPGAKFEDVVRAFVVHHKARLPEDVEQHVAKRIARHVNPGPRYEFALSNGDICQITERRTREGGIVSICTDLTEIRHAEQALRESEALHRLLFDAAPYGIIVVQDGKVVLANPTAARARGFARPEEFIGQSPFVRIHPDDAREVAERARAVLRGDLGGSIPAQYRVLHPDGAVAHMNSAATKFEFRGRPAILIHQNDVTEQVKAREENQALEAQLRRAEKMKSVGTLAEGIAHEFNNLLVPIIGLTELAIDSLPEGDATAAMLDQVLSAAQRSRELIKHIHAFSRAERGGGTPDTVLVQDRIGVTLDLVRPIIPPPIRLDYEADPACGPVSIEHGQLEQILLNLCSNAGDAIGASAGEISIELRPVRLGSPRAAALQSLRQGDYVVLSVRDTGCGMDAATMERIFEPFFTTKEVGRGTGLGLAVIHGLIGACGGAIAVSSEPGKGSEFRVYLPVASVQSETPYVAAQAIG